jgi:hypothetical protein
VQTNTIRSSTGSCRQAHSGAAQIPANKTYPEVAQALVDRDHTYPGATEAAADKHIQEKHRILQTKLSRRSTSSCRPDTTRSNMVWCRQTHSGAAQVPADKHIKEQHRLLQTKHIQKQHRLLQTKHIQKQHRLLQTKHTQKQHRLLQQNMPNSSTDSCRRNPSNSSTSLIFGLKYDFFLPSGSGLCMYCQFSTQSSVRGLAT